MTSRAFMLSFVLLLNLLSCHWNRCNAAVASGGKWDLLLSNIGIAAMHIQLLHTDKVVIFDRTNFGLSNISLPNGRCRNNPNEQVVKVDCTAHSVEYDVAANSVRPLMVQTDTWCSSGVVMPDGTLIQTGGSSEGDRVVRTFSPCSDGSCDWVEINNALFQRRWYASNHLLPDGRQIIIGGQGQFNYEFYPKGPADTREVFLPFLQQTFGGSADNNLYPFVFLNPDGNMFIFANNRAILFNYKNNLVVKTYPEIPGGDPRCYPSTGSAVLLPLTNLKEAATAAEVLVCGGAPKTAFTDIWSGIFTRALSTCARIKISDKRPQWKMETMPMARIMGDMLLLPNGNVLIINGASSGVAGWDTGRDPVLSPVIYRPSAKNGSRFQTQTPSTIPRMYHSTAILLGDGRVLVGGSNPHEGYVFTGEFPTELRLEAYSPSYLDPGVNNLRPDILLPTSQSQILHGQRLNIQFTVSGRLKGDKVIVTMLAPPLTTHSFSQNHRLLVLGGKNVTTVGKSTYQIGVSVPTTGNLAPSGYYLLFVVHQEIPSKGIWVRLL